VELGPFTRRIQYFIGKVSVLGSSRSMLGKSEKIAIVIGVYNPDINFLISQIESIKNQTNKDWLCYISDDSSDNNWYSGLKEIFDSRFILKFWEENLGSYFNFERALLQVQGETVIFLCDQDDIWLPRKIETTLEQFSGNVSLVHSNAELIDEFGQKLPGNLHSLEKTETFRYSAPGLAFKNSITGCTTAIHIRVLDQALPFPDVGGIQHDLWLGLAALQIGKIAYIPNELTLYRQHSSNSIGVRKFNFFNEYINPRIAARAYIIKSQLIRTYLERFGRNTFGSFLSLFLSNELSFKQKLYAANFLFGGLILHSHRFFYRIHQITIRIVSKSVLTPVRKLKKIIFMTSSSRNKMKRILFFGSKLIWKRDFRSIAIYALKLLESSRAISRNQDREVYSLEIPQISPLRYELVNRDERHVVLFVPSLDKKTIFGGLATAIRIGSEIGITNKVQICVTDREDTALTNEFIEELISNLDLNSESFHKMLSRIEYKCVTFSKNDVFVTTAWWTNSKAKQVLDSAEIESVPLYYLVQDFEPIFYASSDLYAAALATYREADFLVVNSSSLAEYISDTLKIYVDPELIFEPQYLKQNLAIRQIPVGRPGPLRIVIYGRPSVERNLFTTLIASLEVSLCQLPLISCEILSVGELHENITLKSGHVVKSLGKLSIQSYLNLLSNSDLGISLMMSPHPSYPPLEMASAGMQVITNDYFGYKKIWERRFPNLQVVEPTISEISATIISSLSKKDATTKTSRDKEQEGNSIALVTSNIVKRF
jgi:glycosyltransferase involved in cell wall biosynthesis